MERTAFEAWFGGIAVLTEAQRLLVLQTLVSSKRADGDCVGVGSASILDPILAVPASEAAGSKPGVGVDTASVADLGQCRVDSVGCPHCQNRDVARWGQASGLPRYRCKACHRTFNALTKTPLANLRMKDKWAEQTRAMIDGVSTAKAAQRCGVHYTTAFRWRHRFLVSLAGDKPKAMDGIVEGDEAFILESFKGKRSDMPRKSRKRGGKSAKRGLSAEQIPVIVARDRHGAMTDAVLPAPGKPNPEAPDFHLNNVDAYPGRLKEWLRRFHGVATKNLPHYLGWRRTLEAMGPKATPAAMILEAIGLGPHQQKTL